MPQQETPTFIQRIYKSQTIYLCIIMNTTLILLILLNFLSQIQSQLNYVPSRMFASYQFKCINVNNGNAPLTAFSNSNPYVLALKDVHTNLKTSQVIVGGLSNNSPVSCAFLIQILSNTSTQYSFTLTIQLSSSFFQLQFFLILIGNEGNGYIEAIPFSEACLLSSPASAFGNTAISATKSVTTTVSGTFQMFPFLSFWSLSDTKNSDYFIVSIFDSSIVGTLIKFRYYVDRGNTLTNIGFVIMVVTNNPMPLNIQIFGFYSSIYSIELNVAVTSCSPGAFSTGFNRKCVLGFNSLSITPYFYQEYDIEYPPPMYSFNFSNTFAFFRMFCMVEYFNCSEIDQNCIKCISHTLCSACEPHYYAYQYTNITSACLPCSEAILGCETCASQSVCISCETPTYLIKNNACSLCSQFIPNCLNCTNNITCIDCADSHVLISPSSCIKCSFLMAGCRQCTSSTQCTYCNPGYYLNGTQCKAFTQCTTQPTWYIQLACTCMLPLFIILPLVRKRSLVLIKLLDIIQMTAYFKYINAFICYRSNFLYLDMRAMHPWDEGWKLLNLANDLVTPIFSNEESYLNKLLRINSIWICVLLLLLVTWPIRNFYEKGKIQFNTFASKNIKNSLCILFYLTVQDLAFFCAANFINPQFHTALSVIFFLLAVIISILALAMLLWQAKTVNYPYEQHQADKLYNYELMFLYRMDYDLFNTYSLTGLPRKEKKTHRYSNLALIDTAKKIGYSFLIISFLFKKNVTLNEQIFSILGYILLFQVMWYVTLPFDPCKQITQIIINITADLIMLLLLLMPTFLNQNSGSTIHLILTLSLFGLAIASCILELTLDIYKLIPYDLYNTGSAAAIEDTLSKQLKQRSQIAQQRYLQIKQLKEEQERRLTLINPQKKKYSQSISNQSLTKANKSSHIMDSEASINNKLQEEISRPQINQVNDLTYPIDETNAPNELQSYRVAQRKRPAYKSNKKAAFFYSNKAEE